MTFELDMKKNHDGITYLDTPGLADFNLREQAAEAITLALKQGGTYQIFFVITLEAGRLRPEDVTTMKLVLDSATDIEHFSLIINKLSKNAHQILFDNNFKELRTMVTELLVQINWSNNPPTLLLLVQRLELYDEENTFIEWDELNEFVQKAPSTNIKSTCVKEIKSDSFSFKQAMDIVNHQLFALRQDTQRLRDVQQQTEQSYFKLMCLSAIARLQNQLEHKGPKDSKVRRDYFFPIFSSLILQN